MGVFLTRDAGAPISNVREAWDNDRAEDNDRAGNNDFAGQGIPAVRRRQAPPNTSRRPALVARPSGSSPPAKNRRQGVVRVTGQSRIRSGQARRSAVSSGPHVTTIIFQGGEIGRDRRFRVGTRERGAMRVESIRADRSPRLLWRERVVYLRGLVLPITIIGAILVFVVPIPPQLLDVLLSANLTVAVVVLLTTLSIRTPQEFSAFPTILLTTTLTRLVLNVATTRLVLTRGGEDKLEAAGGVIKAFGEFVAGDQVIIGVILFSILVVIQFVVITRGATRISEVAARFMLDGLPGRQMAIDADLHAGVIDQHEAHRRRDDVYRQADFFGAMDGAGKFVRGDAVAGVVILLVNIAGGLYLGIFNHEMTVGEAVNVFTKLTIGDGLVSQVPAFLISLACGIDRDPFVVLDRPEPRRDRAIIHAAGRAGDGRRIRRPDGTDAFAQAAAPGAGRRSGHRRDADGLTTWR